MNPEELAAWLITARRLFGEAFALSARVPLRVIVANARNPRQAVEYRIPEPDPAARVVTVTEGVEVHFHPQAGAPPVETGPREGLPVLAPLTLTDRERQVLRVVRARRLPAKEICAELGWPINGTSKGLLSRMTHVEGRQLLEHDPRGYTASLVGRLSLDASDSVSASP